jgi:hypothetical protein
LLCERLDAVSVGINPFKESLTAHRFEAGAFSIAGLELAPVVFRDLALHLALPIVQARRIALTLPLPARRKPPPSGAIPHLIAVAGRFPAITSALPA